MSNNLSNVRNYTPHNSITSNSDYIGDDSIRPFTYTEWLTRVGKNQNDTREFADDYSRYIKSWEDRIKLKNNVRLSTEKKYKNLLKNIALNYTTDEEKRFLTNIDYNKPRHVESAVAFFSRKLKDLARYYSDSRQYIRQNEARYSNIGTSDSIEHQIYTQLPVQINEYKLTNDSISRDLIKETTRTVVNVVELYEVDQSTVINNKIEVDEQVFLDINQAVKNVLLECAPVLSIAPGLSLNVSEQLPVSQQSCEKLDYENFISYVKILDELNVLTLQDYIPGLIGTDMWYVSGGDAQLMIEATKPWRDIYNREGPVLYTNPEPALKSKYQIGQLFVPGNIGLLTYYSHKPVVEVVTDDSIYMIPDPNIYGSDTDVVRHREDVTWVKADAANDGLYGDIIDTNSLPRFFSYRSDEENRATNYVGLSRADDSYGFFTGPENRLWKNKDVFPQEAINIYDIDGRQKTLLTGDETNVSWGTDVFGNEFGLYKLISPKRLPAQYTFGESAADYETDAKCIIIDGGDTLLERPRLWTPGVEYDIYDGGRAPGIDSKYEEREFVSPHPDLRRQVQVAQPDGTLTTELERHNSWYYGPNFNSSGEVDGVTILPTSYHGFIYFNTGVADRGSPIYDQQAYCGLFTDITCGVVDLDRDCVIHDNYAFGTFSDILTSIDGQDYYLSSEYQRQDQTDAFEQYFNSGYENLTFGNNVALTGVELLESQPADGDFFANPFCDPEDAEYEYQLYNGAKYFNDSLLVSETKFVDVEQQDFTKLTTYQQKRFGGKIYFRSYNSSVVDEISNVLRDNLSEFDYFQGSDRDVLLQDIQTGNISDMKICGDVIYIQTAQHFYLDKLNFDETSTRFNKSKYPNIVMRTTGDDNTLEVPIQARFDEVGNYLLCGNTTSFEHAGKKLVSPTIYKVELNNMHMQSIYSVSEQNHEQHMLVDELSAFQYEHVDVPIMTHNEITDVHTMSFSCKLSSESQVVFATRIIDFEMDRNMFKILDDELHYCELVDRYDSNLQSWEKKTVEKDVKFNPDEIQFDGITDTTYNMGLSSVNYETGQVEKDVITNYQLTLNIDTATLPVSSDGYKINKILFDAGDGSDQVIINRDMLTGLEPINFDIGELPDQNDFADPRRYPISHEYLFTDASITSRTSTLTAVYANYKKLIINIEIESRPYSIESAFEDIKLVDAKTYSDSTGTSKQLLVYETQSPRYVFDSTITKPTYNNSSIVGYVNGRLYSGDYHVMMDGTLMTGKTHTPSSQVITKTKPAPVLVNY